MASSPFDADSPGRGYEEPLAQLLTLGNPRAHQDYTQLGIGEAQVAELIRMAGDAAFNQAQTDGDAVWAPVHAWRALGQLGAEAAIKPLVELLSLADAGDEWAGEELPRVLRGFGARAVPALAAFLHDQARGMWGRAAAASTLSKIGREHPESRDACVATLTNQLERYEESEKNLNGIIVAELVELKAVESAPVMERAFEAGMVDLSIQGDWEEVQVELGLLEKRITPKPRGGWFFPGAAPVPSRPTSKGSHLADPGKMRVKNKKKKKDQKKSRRKSRRK